MPTERRIYIVAGPNGAGKTTFARTYLPKEGHFSRFINADLIAVGLSPFRPEAAALRAGRLMLEEIADCIKEGESFAFEDATGSRDGRPARSFASFDAAAEEAALSRLIGGIHFRAAIENGLEQGRCIAAYTVALKTRR